MAFNVVFLHGLMQNAKMMKNDFASMASKLSKFLNITYLEAPYYLESIPAFCQVSNVKTDDELNKMEERFRENYYKKNGKKEHYEKTWYFLDKIGYYSPQMRDLKVIGLEESLDYVLNECKRNNIHGLIGFSQGAVISSILAQRTYDDPTLGWKPKFVVLFSGLMPHTNYLSEVLNKGPKFDLPSLHILGRNDKIVPNIRSLMLSERYVNPVIHYHDGSHTVPDNDDLTVYEKFFLSLKN